MTVAHVAAGALVEAVTRILEAVEVPPEKARTVAESLVDADLEGVSSHGVVLLPMYVERIRRQSVKPDRDARLVTDDRAVAVFDAQHSLGQPIADIAMAAAIEKAKSHGVGISGVRRGFHFGMARRYTLQAAGQGCVGIAMCNTRPLMPAPGGAERMVGNNPISIAVPVAGEMPLVLDMAMSEAAMGKIRMADQTGRDIPDSWATDTDGVPTTDPAKAIEGMLLPVGGHKGFGLAFMVDLLCGALIGGGWGDTVQPLYGDLSVPYNCSHLFIAIDVSHFRPVADFARESDAAAERVRSSRRAPGVERVYTPGERAWERRQAYDGAVALDPSVVDALTTCGLGVGVDVRPGLEIEDEQEGDHGQA